MSPSEYSGRPAFAPTGLEDVIGQFALQLITEEKGVAHSIGTAILVSPHMALTATHVIDQCDKAYGPPMEDASGRRHSSFVMYALQYGRGNDVKSFFIEKLIAARFTDITVLVVNADPDALPKAYPRINLHPPDVGDKVFAFGYAGSASVDPEAIRIKPNGHTSTGEVLDVYPNGRDRALAPFPCFRTNARFDDAMSGGPVFDQHGVLRGLIATNMPPSTEEEEHSSLVTLLWPLMALKIDVPWSRHPELKSYSLHDFFGVTPEGVLGLDRVLVDEGTVRLLPAEEADGLTER
jgi:hypothetical protein